jgi:zinc/manganese transport system substrate-binding protein
MTPQHTGRRHTLIGTALAAAAALLLAGCATSAADTGGQGSGSGGGKIDVVAAENFWGSIATQLGGSHVDVSSIVSNPDTDPHDYEPTPADGRTMAGARFAIVNGIGYDPWAPKLLAANPSDSRVVLTVGQLVGIPDGGNPHRWYSPANVKQVIDQITSDYQRIDPADSAYYARQKQAFETKSLAQYNSLITQIKAKYAGTPIGASESIVTPLAEGLGLKMLTPESFLDAISEGSDPTVSDKTTIDDQIKQQQIKIYVFNSQNSTPDVQQQVNAAKAAGIPVTTVTETLAPANLTFQAWQVKELQGIEQALHQATGK